VGERAGWVQRGGNLSPYLAFAIYFCTCPFTLHCQLSSQPHPSGKMAFPPEKQTERKKQRMWME